MSAETLPGGLREREALAVRRDKLADALMRSLHGPMSREAEDRWIVRLHEYEDLARQIDALGEVVMGPGDWRRATVQTRLDGISDGVR